MIFKENHVNKCFVLLWLGMESCLKWHRQPSLYSWRSWHFLHHFAVHFNSWLSVSKYFLLHNNITKVLTSASRNLLIKNGTAKEIAHFTASFRQEFSENCLITKKRENIVKFCLHFCQAVQVSLWFDIFFLIENSKIRRSCLTISLIYCNKICLF